MYGNFLFHRIDNSPIIVFRIFFGLLMTAECWGAIATGWVKKAFVTPQFTFNFIGFDWTQTLVGETMYYIYAFLGFLGLLIAFGAFYKLASIIFALGWSLVYFMQKEYYNNHHYLIMLVAWMMFFVPANRYKSVDVWIWPQIRTNFTYKWTQLLFVLQLLIVYTFAALAKLYPGWMNGDFLMLRYAGVGQWLNQEVGWEPLTNCVQSREFAQIISWLGFGFDLLIVPLLLWRVTRVPAFIVALFFHLFNSITLQIGIFPYFALAMAIFCFPPETIRSVFFPKKSSFLPGTNEFQPRHKNQILFTFVFFVYILWQIYLPLRHWWIPGDVLWTEEGHRLAWRMMLRTKSSTTQFFLLDKTTGEKEKIPLNEFLTNDQKYRIGVRPDMIWQFSQILKKKYAEKGKDVGILVNSNVSINGGPYFPFIKNDVDLTEVKWKYFGHQDWILPEPADYRYQNKTPSFKQ